jgi:hypothetical protein
MLFILCLLIEDRMMIFKRLLKTLRRNKRNLHLTLLYSSIIKEILPSYLVIKWLQLLITEIRVARNQHLNKVRSRSLIKMVQLIQDKRVSLNKIFYLI